MSLHDLPLASDGFLSYRYAGRYGWVMIGALNDQDALREAGRSGIKDAKLTKLQKWCDIHHMYKPVKVTP